MNTSILGVLRRPVESAQYTSIAFTQRLFDAGIDPSVGSVGDAYDNSMAETHIGLFKNECIRPDGPWRDVNHVEKGTFEWVTWFNTERTHEAIDDLTPIEAEEFYYAHHTDLAEAG